jgi:hypothetical protein
MNKNTFWLLLIALFGVHIIGVLNIPLTIFFCLRWGLNGVVVSQIILVAIISIVNTLSLSSFY